MLQIAIFITILIASYFISKALQPKMRDTSKAVSIDDFDFPQIAEGTPQMKPFGTVRVKGWFILAYGNLRSKTLKVKM